MWIIVSDDGKGLDKERIYRRALENGLINKTESELTEREIFSFIFLPGFSTLCRSEGANMKRLMLHIRDIPNQVAFIPQRLFFDFDIY